MLRETWSIVSNIHSYSSLFLYGINCGLCTLLGASFISALAFFLFSLFICWNWSELDRLDC